MPFSRRIFLRQASLTPFGLWLSPGHAAAATALTRSTPEAEGVSSAGILAFLEAVERENFELHSFMMLRHGKVIAEGWWEPYGPELVHTMYSMSKSFTSTAVGFAVAEGRLKVEDKVLSFFPEDQPAQISEHLAAMRVKDLLTMTSGHEKEPTQACVKSQNWVRTFLAQTIAHPPGTQFMYNSAATYMCSAIVQKLTGQTLLDYLTPRLFTPLGITGMRWESCPRGINTGGWGLSLTTEALAHFGQWLLQQGNWMGQQLLPAAWIDEATRFHIQQPGGDKPDRPKAQNDWLQGYGYQFWRCQGTGYRGDGAFGQFTLVLPEQDAVIVMTSENKNMQGQLDLVWQHLRPALQASDGKASDLRRLSDLKLLPWQGQKAPSTLPPRHFELATNALGLKSLTFEFHDDACVFSADAHRIHCGLGAWKLGETAFPGTPPRLIAGGKPNQPRQEKIAASAAWQDDRTLRMTWRYVETPHRDEVTCEFVGDRVTVRFLNSITAMNPKASDPRAPLVGMARS